MPEYDAVIVGSGPNGLTAAITLAEAGRKVLVLEAKEQPGGGMRTLDVTLPGFHHDICSSVHPLAQASPVFRRLPLARYGVEWVFPPAEVAHPFEDGDALLVTRSVRDTAAQLGEDGVAYARLFSWLVAEHEAILEEFLAPLHLPRNPLVMGWFGLKALPPASLFAKAMFRTERARGLFAGLAAHSIQPLDRPATASFGLMLGMLAHAVGWPLARGGSQTIARALVDYLKDLGGEVVTGFEVRHAADIPPTRATLYDLTPRQLLRILGDALPAGYRRQLGRYRYGPGVFKLDYALSAPIPWKDPACLQAGTVHLGATLDEVRNSERRAFHGSMSDKPFTLVAQPTLFDPSRAPDGKHIAWVYCHVPHGSTQDWTDVIEAQIERFAPGFREVVLARQTMNAMDMQHYNANYIGGDINGGVQDLGQLFTRPVLRRNPYTTPLPGVFLCSSSTPPGGGVHGMCGWFAAQTALRERCR
jgi:phytoene dehydrogenase-like protein